MEVPESQTGAGAGDKHTKPKAAVGRLLKASISAEAEAHESSSSSHQKSMEDLQELPCFRLGGDGVVDELDPLSAVLGVQFPISSSYPAIAHDSEAKNLDPRSVVQHRCPCEWFMCDDQASHTHLCHTGNNNNSQLQKENSSSSCWEGLEKIASQDFFDLNFLLL
jgi:hypothetical protein